MKPVVQASFLTAICLLPRTVLPAATTSDEAQMLRVAVAQTCDARTFGGTVEKFVEMTKESADQGARLVVFPEEGLSGSSSHAELEAGIEAVRQAARANRVYVVLCTGEDMPSHEVTRHQNRLYVFGPEGEKRLEYPKLSDGRGRPVPTLVSVDGKLVSLVICSDRALLPVESLVPVMGAQVLIECSCNDYDEWRVAHQWYLYAPRAVRNTAYVIFCNKRQMRGEPGMRRGHGHSAVIAPDASVMVTADEETDKVIIADLNLGKATREMAIRRAQHPLFRDWWAMGEDIVNGEDFPMPSVRPLASSNYPVQCGYGLMPCTSRIDDNVRTIQAQMKKAAAAGVDLLVFPELAVTGAEEADIKTATPQSLSAAIESIRQAARQHQMTVVVGAPSLINGKWRNSAYAIGPDGKILTRYDQIVVSRPELFEGGMSTKAMWFQVKGVWSYILIGDDAIWREMAELAAVRGARILCHLRSDRNATPEEALLHAQMVNNIASYGTLTVVANTDNKGVRTH